MQQEGYIEGYTSSPDLLRTAAIKRTAKFKVVYCPDRYINISRGHFEGCSERQYVQTIICLARVNVCFFKMYFSSFFINPNPHPGDVMLKCVHYTSQKSHHVSYLNSLMIIT